MGLHLEMENHQSNHLYNIYSGLVSMIVCFITGFLVGVVEVYSPIEVVEIQPRSNVDQPTEASLPRKEEESAGNCQKKVYIY